MHAPQKSFVDAGAGAGVGARAGAGAGTGAGAGASALHDRLVTLTCARQQANTPNIHITLLQFAGAVCMQYVFLQSSLRSRIVGDRGPPCVTPRYALTRRP